MSRDELNSEIQLIQTRLYLLDSLKFKDPLDKLIITNISYHYERQDKYITKNFYEYIMENARKSLVRRLKFLKFRLFIKIF